MKRLFAIGIAANAIVWGLYCILQATGCSPQERQDAVADVARVAVHAAVVDLIEYCRPTDTVADCIDNLLEYGIREIHLAPTVQDGGAHE